MSTRPSRGQPPNQGGAARQNEYFVPRDGIDREVITADICRYLGNDALVRPGTYEAPDGRVTQGYFITAYRNLTTAMIQDLKADSARWEQERRSTSRSAGGSAGGTTLPSQVMNGVFARKSNSPTAPSSRDPPRYHTSETHQHRQFYGPTSGDAAQAGYGDPMAVDYPNAPLAQPAATPRYPGTGNDGYYGVSSNNPAPAPAYGAQPGYGSQAQQGYSGYGSSQYQVPHAAVDRTGAPATGPGVQPTDQYNLGAPYVATGANYNNAAGATDYTQNRMAPPPVPASSRAQAYGQTQSGGYAQDPYYGAQSNYSQPIDAFYGRGQGGAYNAGIQVSAATQASSDAVASPAGAQSNTGYSTLPDAQQQYSGQPQAPPSSSRTPVPASSTDTQMTNSGTPGATSRREGERDARERPERPHRERGDRDRERERDREDRHANERREHRQHRHR
ncbi:hypothetical protein GQ53DRAFT_831585 [Thozetella sp. PMI_491]|nr:hypothetical protein GQ53DRAFT_831585 [Thozetella sp. PMI_491]